MNKLFCREKSPKQEKKFLLSRPFSLESSLMSRTKPKETRFYYYQDWLDYRNACLQKLTPSLSQANQLANKWLKENGTSFKEVEFRNRPDKKGN